jgi:hypothetical protein
MYVLEDSRSTKRRCYAVASASATAAVTWVHMLLQDRRSKLAVQHARLKFGSQDG